MASELIRKHGKTIRLGMAVELAYRAIRPEEGRRSPTRAEIKNALGIVSADIDLEKFSPPELLRWYYLGRQNPKPLVEELSRKIEDLSRYTRDEAYQASVRVAQFLVSDLLLYFCQVPKWSGRPNHANRRHR